MSDLLQHYADFWRLIGDYWYWWAPISLFFIFRQAWLGYVRGSYLSRLKPILLEIRVPREIAKSPKAMESIFAGFTGASKSIDLVEKYWDGFCLPWFSLEIVGDGETGVHFYIWTDVKFRRLVEAQVFAQYPSCEISEIEDYSQSLPQDIPNNDWNLWGTELMLTKPDAYPIRTYEDFTLEEVSEKEELRKSDPLSAMIEFMGSLQHGEKCWVQFLVRSANEDWKKEGEALIAKIMGREIKKQPNILEQILVLITDFLASFSGPPTTVSSEKKEDFGIFKLSPGQQETIKAVEKNMTKIGFETGIRWMYLARRDVFNPVGISAMMGIFKQFASQSLNGFRPHPKTMTKSGYFQYISYFKNRIETRKKSRLYRAYRMRSFFYPPYHFMRPFVLSSSELATVYHFPGMVVSAAAIGRIEAKKATPPPNLPM